MHICWLTCQLQHWPDQCSWRLQSLHRLSEIHNYFFVLFEVLQIVQKSKTMGEIGIKCFYDNDINLSLQNIQIHGYWHHWPCCHHRHCPTQYTYIRTLHLRDIFSLQLSKCPFLFQSLDRPLWCSHKFLSEIKCKIIEFVFNIFMAKKELTQIFKDTVLTLSYKFFFI